jgi:phosphate transport system substrate-binding protein
VASQRASNGLVQQAVKSSPTGVGYVSLAFATGLNALSYKGVACTLRNSKAGTYGGLRNFWLVSRGNPTGAAAKWIKWVRNDADALRITAEQWVPLK